MPGGRPMTVVFSAMSSATPRTMKEVPRVTMKAGTLSLAMMTPLTKPMKPAVATAAVKPMTAEGKSGTPALKAQRMASAEVTEQRLITQPTERSMPAPMMTKVWPRPRSRIGVMATRMFCELRMVRKLTVAAAGQRHGDDEEGDHEAEEGPGPEVAEGEDEPLRRSPGRGRAGIESGHSVAFVGGDGRWRERPRGAPGCARRSAAGHLVDEARDLGVGDVVLVDDREAGLHPLGQAGDAGGVGGGELRPPCSPCRRASAPGPG